MLTCTQMKKTDVHKKGLGDWNQNELYFLCAFVNFSHFLQ